MADSFSQRTGCLSKLRPKGLTAAEPDPRHATSSGRARLHALAKRMVCRALTWSTRCAQRLRFNCWAVPTRRPGDPAAADRYRSGLLDEFLELL